jgi:alkylation response protein AidB-like acyl-CoA dehydrogenase
MDIELNEEQKAFVQVARDFAQGVFAPHAAHWDEKEIFPREALREAGALGLCSLYASTDIGGLGLSRLDASLVFEELAAIDPSTTAFLTIHNLATWMIGLW